MTHRFELNERELKFRFIRSRGPGGQNVNKVSSGVQLRWDINRSPSLPHALRLRLIRMVANRINSDGILLITADRHRSQYQNRQDAIERLKKIVRQAAIPPKFRRATRPSISSNKRRLESKKRHGLLKRSRQGRCLDA